jgi:hypothetical protein
VRPTKADLHEISSLVLRGGTNTGNRQACSLASSKKQHQFNVNEAG